jgi:hypothetical protein
VRCATLRNRSEVSERRLGQAPGTSAPSNDRSNEDRVIRASEIGRYVYCARAWWLGSIQNLPSSRQREMAAGESAHRRHGWGVTASIWLNRLAYVVLLLAAVAGVVWLISQWAR